MKSGMQQDNLKRRAKQGEHLTPRATARVRSYYTTNQPARFVYSRGEGSWVDVEWAFMVARCGSPGDAGSSMNMQHARATMKAHPSPLHHPRPYRHRWAFLKLTPKMGLPLWSPCGLSGALILLTSLCISLFLFPTQASALTKNS